MTATTSAKPDLTPVVRITPFAVSHRYVIDFRLGWKWAYPAEGRPGECCLFGPEDEAPAYNVPPSPELEAMLEACGDGGVPNLELLKRFAFEYNRWESFTMRSRGN